MRRPALIYALHEPSFGGPSLRGSEGEGTKRVVAVCAVRTDRFAGWVEHSQDVGPQLRGRSDLRAQREGADCDKKAREQTSPGAEEMGCLEAES